MTKRDFAFVGCKLLGLYYFAQALYSGFYNIAILNRLRMRYPYCLGFIIQAIVGCILWFAADFLARRIAPEEPEKT